MPRGNLNRAAGTKRPASETGFNGSNRKAQRSTADATASKREAAEVTDSAYVQFLRLEVDRIYKSFKDTTSNKVWFTKAMAQLKNLLDDPQLETVSFNTYFASAIA